MKEKLKINVTKPQYVQVSDITYAQVDCGMITVAGI